MKSGRVYVIAATPAEAEILAIRSPGKVIHDPDRALRLFEIDRGRGRDLHLFTLVVKAEALRSEISVH